MITTAVILAAGRGTRLKEVTATRSKALAPVAGTPMIGRVIEMLREAGITEWIVVGAPHDRELAAYCAELPSVRFVTQPEPRGSGDALRVSASHLPADFLVCACDSLYNPAHVREILQQHARTGACGTLSVMEVSADVSLSSRSVVRCEGDRVLDIVEKPTPGERFSNITSLPLYVLSHEIFRYVEALAPSPRGEFELPTAFRGAIKEGKDFRALVTKERCDLTNLEDLLSLNMHILQSVKPEVQIDSSVLIPQSVVLVPPVIIESGVSVGEGARLGPSVYVERGARIGTGCSLERVVVLRDVSVERSCKDLIVT